jgi:phage-related holin
MPTIFTTAKIAWGGLLIFIDVAFLTPKFNLIWVLCAFIIVDFITGVIKAKIHKKARTSAGYRKTIIKVSQYLIPVFGLFGLSWLAKTYAPDKEIMIKQVNGFIMYFIMYIELTSILENLYEVDNTSTVAKYLYKPLLKILKFGIENNPAAKAAGQIKDDNDKPK